MQRTLILVGLIILGIGLAWPFFARLPLGRLPGDILIKREYVKIYFPITTCIVVSLVVSFILWFFRR
jgi:hypothetical protein